MGIHDTGDVVTWLRVRQHSCHLSFYFTDTKEAVPFYAPRDFRKLKTTSVTALVELRSGYWITSRAHYEDILKLTGGRLMFDVQLDQKIRKTAGEDLLLVRFQSCN